MEKCVGGRIYLNVCMIMWGGKGLVGRFVCVCVRKRDVSMWSNSVFFVYLSVCVCDGGMSVLFASVWCGWFC